MSIVNELLYLFSRDHCAHVLEGTNEPWWAADLGTARHVTQVTIYNRIACCGGSIGFVV